MTRPRTPRHLHMFGISLLVILTALLALLFGVSMEANVPATGLAEVTVTDAAPLIRLELEEKHFGAIAVGQEVRLYCTMYPHRTHGIAHGVIEHLEKVGVEGPNQSRRFHAICRVTDSPFPILPGSSSRAEVVTGRKPTYRIILEH